MTIYLSQNVQFSLLVLFHKKCPVRGICVCGAWVYSFYIGACNRCLESSLYGIRCIRSFGMVFDLIHLSPLCSVRDLLMHDEMLLVCLVVSYCVSLKRC